jgi:hypothetical protein
MEVTMKYKTGLLILTSCLLFNFAFADNKASQNKIDYDRFEKYWEKQEYVVEYLKRANENYNNYINNTKFDNKFEISPKEQTAGYGSASSRNILILINQFLYNPQTLDEINTFKNDLESEGYSVNIVTSTNTNEPDTLRDYLYQQWTENNIDGAFLIGGLAIAWYEMPITNENGDTTDWDVFPCDLYYMDLDGEWRDNENNNGIHDDHTGNVAPDIWIGRFYTPTMTFHDVSESQHVETYLNKIHQYREGSLRLKNQGFSYVQEDWAGYHMENEVLKLYDEVTFVNDGINGNVTKSDYKNRIKAATNNKYEWMYLAAHSSPWDHYFSDGLFNSEEIDPLDVQVLFYLNFNCSAASYREDDCLCNWYVMQEPYGLLSVGSTKGGSMLYQYDYYEPLNEGYTFGEAFKYWGIRHYNIRDWHYGMSVIGDPTLKVSRFMANPSPKFCYAVAPEKEALLGDTVPLFKWTTNDSADNYQVEITKSTTVIWTSDETTDTLVQMPTGILEHGCSYKWTVKAYSGLECIDFTQKRKFTIKDTISNYLSDLAPEYHSQDWGTLQFDKSCDGNAIKINGKEYEKGLGTHANSIVRYSLNGEYKLFTAVIGHDDESNGGNGITFEVELDGNTIYGPSKVFMWGTEAENIELNVTNGYKLELLVHGRGDIDYDHADWADAIIWVDSIQTTIEDNNLQLLLPKKITLISSYPNPFNCFTTILFHASPKLPVSLSIYNVLGQKVKTLIDNKKLSGIQKIKWDGTDYSGSVVSSGLYFCRISDGNEHQSAKILLMK